MTLHYYWKYALERIYCGLGKIDYAGCLRMAAGRTLARQKQLTLHDKGLRVFCHADTLRFRKTSLKARNLWAKYARRKTCLWSGLAGHPKASNGR
jgi:hypothetical protein